MGRFLNHDVVYDLDAGLQGYNLFVYCGNNPVRRVDISGADSVDMIDGDEDADEPQVKDGGCGHGQRLTSAPSNPSGNGNAGNSGCTHASVKGSHVTTSSTAPQQPTKYYHFKSEYLLNKHFINHNREMGYKYHNPQEYEYDANQVIQHGEYIPDLNAYVRFYNYWGGCNYLFVGMTDCGGFITTFHIKSAHKVWK
jgi:hypothetical protein